MNSQEMQIIRSHLDDLLQFLQPRMGFVNCHMVNYITSKLWDDHVPKEIKMSIRNKEDVQEAMDEFYTKPSKPKFPALSSFVQSTEQRYLENLTDVVTSKNEFLKFLTKEETSAVNIKEFMSEKKNHEVEVISLLVSKLIESSGTPKKMYVVDAGDGKGYLSSRLALEKRLQVLGIDASEVNTKGAQERNQKLERAWNGLKKRAELVNQGVTPPRRGRKPLRSEPLAQVTPENYKMRTAFITPDSDLPALVQDAFLIDKDDVEICLCGLHTCGNLGPTCLQLFVHLEPIKILCNVGCCYHLLNEEFAMDPFANQNLVARNPDVGFPLSKYLRDKKVQLGRNARMLASQSIHRTIQKREVPCQSLFYRALLEVLIQEFAPQGKRSIKVGKIKNYSNFKEYVRKCDEKLGLNLRNFDEGFYESLLNRYENDEAFLSLFYLIRMSFAPVLEAVILLDRLLYLKENSIGRSFLVPLFDPLLSPRNFGIVGVKNFVGDSSM